jgi:GTP cyclohydrolase I
MRSVDLEEMERGVITLLSGMGVDLRDPNFADTPRRVAKMYAEMLTPQANNWTTFPAQAADIVLLRGHKVFSLCPHHLMPIEYRCYVAYIPNKLTIGLSKLARVVEMHLTQPLMQEDLAHRVAASLQEHLDPKGCAVVLAGVHGCMRYRGVESDGDVVVSVMKGVFLLNPNAKSELMQLIGRP